MRWIIGFVLIFTGVVYLGDSLSFWHAADFSVVAQCWPILLILLGLSILLKRFKYGRAVVFALFVLTMAFIFYVVVFNKNLIKTKNTDTVSSPAISATNNSL